MIQITMIFRFLENVPVVHFKPQRMRGPSTTFLAPLAELPAYVARAFFIIETIENN